MIIEQYIHNSFDVEVHDQLSSTNQFIDDANRDQIKERWVVQAKDQTKGRGQIGNSWESEAEKNLTFSILIHPSYVLVVDQFKISQAASLALVHLLKKYGINAQIKWPNDIYIDEEKVAGILIEHSVVGSSLFRSCIGIGLNVNQRSFYSDAPNPVSMVHYVDKELDSKMVLNHFLDIFNDYLENIKKGDSLKNEYMSYLYRKNGEFKWRDSHGEFMAHIEDIDQYGRLILKRDGGMISIYGFKEVQFCK